MSAQQDSSKLAETAFKGKGKAAAEDVSMGEEEEDSEEDEEEEVEEHVSSMSSGCPATLLTKMPTQGVERKFTGQCYDCCLPVD